MGDPLSSVSVEDRMLVSLYNTLNDQPNVVTEGSVTQANGFIRDERARMDGDDWVVGSTRFFTSGVPSDLNSPVAHRVLLTSLTRRLETMGYTVQNVTSSGYGYQFNLSLNGRTVNATLYPADLESDGDRSFLTRLEWTAEILQSPVSANVSSVDIESHTQTTTFRLADGGWVFLDDHYLTSTAFRNASRAYQALRSFGGYGEAGEPSAEGRPTFSGSILVDAHGDVSASYAYPGHGDMPHVAVGRSADLGDAAAIRQKFRRAVDARIAE